MSQYSRSLDQSGVIDITTTGATSGIERRIEINFVQIDGRHFITGKPGRKRDWLANLKANPHFTVHLKGTTPTDIPVQARLITDLDERTDVLYKILTEAWGNEEAKTEHILPEWVEKSPLIEFAPV
ncbi:MAG: nitroreductase/quinone reductase family protein [Acidimicrobiia bacterium]